MEYEQSGTVADCGHASRTRYQKGCRCAACCEANRIYLKQYQLMKSSGRKGLRESNTTDIGPARERLLELYAMGYTMVEIERFGVSRTTQYRLIDGRYKDGRPAGRVSLATLEKLQAISGRRLTKDSNISMETATRLVRWWMGAGLTASRISERTGVSVQCLYNIEHGRRRNIRMSTMISLIKHKQELDDMAAYARGGPRGRPRMDRLSEILSDWEVVEAYRRHQGGADAKYLARQYGVSRDGLLKMFARLEERVVSADG